MAEAETTFASLDEFLRHVERRAFQMARMTCGSRDDALDVVQEAMCKLVEKYAHKPSEEWRPLFYRILNSKITDYHRRRSVRDKVLGWTARLNKSEDSDDFDPVTLVAGPEHESPHEMLERERRAEQLSSAVMRLPVRQREAFMLRCWEGMSTAETASAMQCTEGSVKTHYSRAMQALRTALESY